MRLFVAIDLPETVRQTLDSLAAGVPGARWVTPENLHLTLRFIGEVDGATVEDVIEALAGVRAEPFDVTIEGVGHFETGRRPRMIWAGVAPSAPLQRLHTSVDMALQRVGLAPEGRRYLPHVTLARLRDAPPARVQSFLAEHAGFREAPFPVASFTLYSSFLGRGGALYRAEAGFDFDRAGGPAQEEDGELWDPWQTEGR